jgi:hypothetical protein
MKMNEGYNGIAHDLETLRTALERIAAGQEMSGIWTHAETVVRYQEIARKALGQTTVRRGT